LLVEDEMLVSLLIEDVLFDAGCVIVGPFDRVPDGIRAARAEYIDVAILDVNIAGIKVYPVAEILAAREIPFLFLSGYGQQALPADRPDWRACNKPFKPAELVETLIDLVHGR
jgi:DNA-binding response OmpR family regulator